MSEPTPGVRHAPLVSDASDERRALLHGGEGDCAAGAAVAEAPGRAGKAAPPLEAPVTSWRGEWAAQAREAAPLCVFNALQFSISAISIGMVGRTGALNMAAAALASSFLNVCGTSFLIGTTMTLETTASQAFGAGELRSIGVSLQRAWLANAALSCAISAIWWNAGAAFVAFGQDGELARLAGAYSRACIPHAWLLGAQYPLQKVLQAQGVMLPFGAIGLALLAFHVLVTRAAVQRRGYLGATGALCATDALSLALTAGVYAFRERRASEGGRTWHGITADALRGWPAFLRLAAPGVLMLVIEWSTFETVTLLSGLLPGAASGGPTAASAVAFNTIMLAFSLPLGFANAGSARVGAALGRGDAPSARRSAAVTFAAAAGGQALLASLLGGLGGARYARLYTGDGPGSAEALSAFRSVLPALAVLVVGDGMQCALSGVVRGAGAQAIAARFNLVAYYIVGLPFGATLAFAAHVGLRGLWIGLAVATNGQAAMLAAFLWRMDWRTCAAEAHAAQMAQAQTGGCEKAAATEMAALNGADEERQGLLGAADVV